MICIANQGDEEACSRLALQAETTDEERKLYVLLCAFGERSRITVVLADGTRHQFKTSLRSVETEPS